jgi:hypothetical protein
MPDEDKIQKGVCLLDTDWKGCCCECEYQTVLHKHPWNKEEYANGSISEIMGYVCHIPGDMGAIFFDRKHSFCEEFVKRKGI